MVEELPTMRPDRLGSPTFNNRTLRARDSVPDCSHCTQTFSLDIATIQHLFGPQNGSELFKPALIESLSQKNGALAVCSTAPLECLSV
jgi:hypothetical protein